MSLPKTVQPGKPKLPEPPSGWAQSPLGHHLTEIRRPAKLADDDTYSLVTVKRARGGVVKRADMTGKEISVKSQFYLEPNDFLISKRQIVHGACGVVPEELAGSIVSNEYSVFNCRDTFDLDFLKYLSHSVYFQQTCFHSSIGVHVEKLIFKVDQWLKWNFNVPPLAEQKKIAKILSTWDQSIETTSRLVATAAAQKKALMRELLSKKRRLPGFDANWRELHLGELGEFVKGKGVSRGEVVETGLPAIRYGEIYTTHHFIIEEFSSFIDDASAEAAVKLETGDILFTCSGETAEEIGKSVAFVGDHAAYAGGDIIILRDHGQSAEFLGYALNSSPVVRQKARFGQGNSVVHISAENLSKIVIQLPPIEEQRAISQVVSAAHFELRKWQRLLDQQKSEKAALMQQLLTGKRRVKLDGGV